ncbi:MAG: hypothetical protein LUG88_08975 [Clostridia bacterium]|nr:hypothetical protein [Clostridia bacterium]
MKRFISLFLALAMVVLAVASCSGETEDTPQITLATDDTTDASGNNNSDETDDGNEVTEYEPDSEVKYGGMVGMGVISGAAYFDYFKLVSLQSDGYQLVDEEYESSLPEGATYVTSSESDWSIVVDPTEVEEEEETEETTDETSDETETEAETEEETTASDEEYNHAAYSAAEGYFYVGETTWNYYQLTTKVLVKDDDTVLALYFCMTDENNYYYLTVGENSNTTINVYKVTDGTAEKFTTYKVKNYSLTLDTWTAVGISVQREYIAVYIGGSLCFSIYNEDYNYAWYDYEGDVTSDEAPASVVELAYGAPGEGAQFYYVSAENVINDGKGTWSNYTTTVATMAFDCDTSTYYDADETVGYENTDDENVGIVLYEIGLGEDWTATDDDGNALYTAYVGAYIEEGIVLKYIRFCPRSDQTARMVDGYFEASVDGENWTTLYTVEETPTASEFVTVDLSDNETTYYYVRYVCASGCYGNVAEIELWY